MPQANQSHSSDGDFLLRGFRENDRRTLELIYAENYLTVERFVLKNSGSSSDAKDIFQDALVAAWVNVNEGKYQSRDGNSLGGYIFQIAKFKWLDRVKSKKFRSTVRLEREEAVYEDEAEKRIEEDERLQRLQRIYSKLDAKCKSILNRFYFEKMSLEDIGQELGHDAGTVKTLKYRCMQKMKSFTERNK